jgi:hypothetical protein
VKVGQIAKRRAFILGGIICVPLPTNGQVVQGWIADEPISGEAYEPIMYRP